MPTEYELPHINISDRVRPSPYKAHRPKRPPSPPPRDRDAHGRFLLDQLRRTFSEIQSEESPREDVERAPGAYYEVDLRKGADAESLDRKRLGLKAGATHLDMASNVTTVLYVPDEAIPALEAILQDYRSGPLTAKGQKPPNDGLIGPIEDIRRARLQSFWTDPLQLLPSPGDPAVWWEVWCHEGTGTAVAAGLTRLGCRLADRELWLAFPEAMVIPAFGRRVDIEVALFALEGISELRRGSDTPSLFLHETRENQYAWAENLAERIVWPGANVPRVCVLDTGVNRAHMLLEPAISESDLMTVRQEWTVTDNTAWPHGTEMAGLALHGDLFASLVDQREIHLRHRVESVRLLPSDGFPPNEPARLGTLTQAAVAIAEIRNPQRDRVFCLAVTNENISGERGSSWSACIDRTAAGQLAGDEIDRPRRLFFVSAGNRPPFMNASDFGPETEYAIEDPAQAWNVVTVGGYTDKVLIGEPDLQHYRPVAQAGELSPFSRNSIGWQQGKAPIKPEVVFEAGNRARSSNGRDLLSCTSLELLTTGSDVDQLPIVNFNATSAATALASRFAARLKADFPDAWPETLRALMIHSAEWTPAMKRQLSEAPNQKARVELIRGFGYGVPSLDRARSSGLNDMALLIEQEIQPFERKEGGHIGFNECHYYPLPLPKRLLESRAFDDKLFEVKVTLSYFVEPNPGRAAAVDPLKYQSYGLRFDLKRPTENFRDFKIRINAAEEEPPGPNPADPGWVLGQRTISAGSLHCDVWRGTGAQLAARDVICVRPITGWWKARKNPAIYGRSGRYSLIVTLSAPDLEIDLYTPIFTRVTAPVDQALDIEQIIAADW